MKHWIYTLATALLLVSIPVRADDGEFWEHAVSETIPFTKPMTDTWVKLFAGGSATMDVQENELIAIHVPAQFRLDAGARFLGFAPNDRLRIVRLRGEIGLGIYDDNHTEIDSFSARLNCVTLQKGGLLNLGSVGISSEKALNEKLDLRVDALDLNMGGAARAFVFGVSARSLGYERRENFDDHVYHGFYLVSLGIDMGFVIFRSARVLSLEIKTGGDIELSLPTQKDATADAALVLHVNNDLAPLELAAIGSFKYVDDSEADDELHFWNLGGRLSVRF